MTFIGDATTALLAAGYTVEDSGSGADGIIVALAIPPEVGAHLAVPGGEAPEELHVTLAYLGKASDLSAGDAPKLQALADALRDAFRGEAPLTLVVTGAGTFEHAGDGDTDASYLRVDGDGLQEMRARVVELCARAGLPASTRFPEFKPHVTLAYTPHGRPHPDPHPPRARIPVPDVQLWYGGQHASVPLGATLAKAQPAPGKGKRPDALARARQLYAELTGDLIRLNRQTGQVRAQTDAVRAHHEAAADRLGAAIRAPRGSALEDAYLEHAAEARAARSLTDA